MCARYPSLGCSLIVYCAACRCSKEERSRNEARRQRRRLYCRRASSYILLQGAIPCATRVSPPTRKGTSFGTLLPPSCNIECHRDTGIRLQGGRRQVGEPKFYPGRYRGSFHIGSDCFLSFGLVFFRNWRTRRGRASRVTSALVPSKLRNFSSIRMHDLHKLRKCTLKPDGYDGLY